MRHPRWLHIACLTAPIAAVVLLLGGFDRGLAVLVWLLCPVAMLLMMRMMSHGGHHESCDHADHASPPRSADSDQTSPPTPTAPLGRPTIGRG